MQSAGSGQMTVQHTVEIKGQVPVGIGFLRTGAVCRSELCLAKKRRVRALCPRICEAQVLGQHDLSFDLRE